MKLPAKWAGRTAMASAAALLIALPATASASTTESFCGGSLAGNTFCSRHIMYTITGMAVNGGGTSDQCVYPGTNTNNGAPSATGSEYCTSAGQVQAVVLFNNVGGNPEVHNRHSYSNNTGSSFSHL